MIFKYLTTLHGSARIAVAALVLFLAPASYSQMNVAYAWANQPTKASYSPSDKYRYNPARGRVSITRKGVGKYTVTFDRFGTDKPRLGHVQVTAYGSKAAHCQVRNWSASTSKFTTTVDCYSARLRPIDSMFTVAAMLPRNR